MGRTQSVSDEEILEAARRVIARSGYDAFTLTEVADDVGLSRAAIILRFQSTQALKLRLTAKLADEFVTRIEALPAERGAEGLLALARFIGSHTRTRASVQSFMQRLRTNEEDPKLAAIDNRMIAAFHGAISARMPETALTHEAAVLAFRAHIGGSLMNWQTEEGIEAADYLEQRTRDWLKLAHIPVLKAARAAKRK